MTLTLAAGAAKTLTAQQLEAGDGSVAGRLGAGVGKWRLTVSSDRPLEVANIVVSAAGHWSNLSTTAARGAAPPDLDAFAERFEGRNIVQETDAGISTFTPMADGRFAETDGSAGDAAADMGDYDYTAIGPEAGLLTLDYDDGERCRANLYFSTRTGGWFASHCTATGDPDGRRTGGTWSLGSGEVDAGDGAVMETGYAVNDALPGVPVSGAFTPTITGGGSILPTGTGTTIVLNHEAYFELSDGTRYTCAAPDGCTIANGTVTAGAVTGRAAGAGEAGRFPGECRVGMTLSSGQSCTYPGTADEFSVNARGRGSFLGRLAGIRIRIDNETIDGRVYDFEASHRGGGVWRIDRIAGSDEPPDGAADSQEPESNTSPSFADACFPQEIWYWDGEPIPPLTLPAATGGNAPLTYTLEVVSAVNEYWDLDPRPPLIPGLSFDPARRQIAGTPMTNADSNWPYGLKYRVTDADGDTDEFEFDVLITGIGSHSHGHALGNRCDQSLTASFTDSTGRTILYRLRYGKDWDLSEPRGVELYFHANITGTELDILRHTQFSRSDPIVTEKGMLRAAVVSPYSYPNPDFSPKGLNDGTRSWLPDDARLIHELLQSDFGGTAAIDRDRIVFTGDSQGPCFINYFLQRYANVYGGGFHSHCGCLYWGNAWPPRSVTPWSPTVLWTPHARSSVSDRFRVFVQATTGDFLYGHAVAMRDFFRDVLGFETRWDLDAPGGHCASGATPYSSIFEWLTEPTPVPSVFGAVAGDHDGDGLADAIDPDDDNDGAPDIVDALPLEPREWLDTDADGIGNFEDRDADGDGILNAADAFPMNPLEWIDNDEDGIGDNLDTDDDNDGVADEHDDEPLRGARNDQLSFKSVLGLGLDPRDGYPANPKPAQSHIGRPASIVYPDAHGNRQSYFFIALGDSADAVFEIMVDTHESGRRCEDVLPTELCRARHEGGFGDFHEERLHLIYIDGNRNRDLSDDGPPLVMADNKRSRAAPYLENLGVSVILHVPYASGERLPYRIALTTLGDQDSELGLGYNVSSFWIGYVSVPGAEPVLAGTFDGNLDGVFNTGTYGFDDVFEVTRRIAEDGEPASRTRLVGVTELDDFKDHACVDLNRDDILNDCGLIISLLEEDAFAPIYSGERFTLDDRECALDVSPTGHRVRIECS